LLAERARIIATYSGDVVAALPEAEAAVAELAQLLRGRGTAVEAGRGTGLTLASLGRAVAEDLCILTAAPDGADHPSAGMLCFPNRWRLAEKLGGDVLAVHGPVPDYAKQLSAGVDRFLARLRPDRAFIRSNWGLADTDALFLPNPGQTVDPRVTPNFFLR